MYDVSQYAANGACAAASLYLFLHLGADSDLCTLMFWCFVVCAAARARLRCEEADRTSELVPVAPILVAQGLDLVVWTRCGADECRLVAAGVSWTCTACVVACAAQVVRARGTERAKAEAWDPASAPGEA